MSSSSARETPEQTYISSIYSYRRLRPRTLIVLLPEPLWRTADSSPTWWKWTNTETTQWRVWKTSCYFSWMRVSRFSRLSRSCLLSRNAEVITPETPPSPTGMLINLRNAALTDVSKGKFGKEAICCKVEVYIFASITTHTLLILWFILSLREEMTFCSTSAWYLISHKGNISLQITSGFPCDAIIHLKIYKNRY